MRRFASLLATGLLAAGCATAGGAGATSSPSPEPTYDVGTGPGDLILKLTEGGGLFPLEYLLTGMPTFALYGDGRIIVQGPTTEIYPSPLLPNLRVIRVTPAEIQKIVGAADQAGLLGPDAHYDATNIFDAGSSVFVTIVAGKTHTISAYALFADGTTENAATAAARARLMTFHDRMEALSEFLGRPVSDEEAYEPAAMRVFVSAANETPQPDGLERQVVDWPLAVDPATAGQPTTVPNVRCLLLSGADLATFLSVARTANALTIWQTASGRYSVMVRPLYPDESGCPLLEY
jgi:hypothetical protein